MPAAIDHVRTGLAVALGTAFTWIGIQHFVDVNWFVPIVPAILGWPEFWVYVSGGSRNLLGLGLILPSTRARAGRWTARFLLLVYWANLNMWVNDIPIVAKHSLRLPTSLEPRTDRDDCNGIIHCSQPTY